MANITHLFHNLTFDQQKLLMYGFTKQGDSFNYVTNFKNAPMKLQVQISSNQVEATIIDNIAQEEYVLIHVLNAQGSFVGALKEEYDTIIHSIIRSCCEQNILQCDQTKKIIEYVAETYHDNLEFLWNKFPNDAIVRNSKSGKWYLLLVNLPKQKIGISEEGNVDIINLKNEPDTIQQLIDHKYFFPAYHMNKKYWITIKLDGSVPFTTITRLIDKSYIMSNIKKKSTNS